MAVTAGLISYANRRWYDAGVDQKELLGLRYSNQPSQPSEAPLSDAVQTTLDSQQVDNLELEIVAAMEQFANFRPT